MKLTHPDWNPRVKEALNDFLSRNAHKPNAYVCFDFDNTSSIFDVEEQLMIYQLETMAFAVDPSGLKQTLLADLDKTDLLCDYVDDVVAAYTILWNNYGPFTARGIAPELEEKMGVDPYWQEFATKMRVMYDWVSKGALSPNGKRPPKSYAWELYWFTGMTPDEVYDLAMRSHKRYSAVKTYWCQWESPAEIKSKIGVVGDSWYCGVTVPQNTQELWATLSEAGIDVWIVSASAMEPIKAAVDCFGLHPYIKGVLAMTIQKDDTNRYVPVFDQQGVGEIALPDGTWQKMALPIHTMTYRSGKVSAIENALFPLYAGHGPIAGFMDAVGDFYFCTEFDSLQLVVCFNRAASSASDGAGLIATVAKYIETCDIVTPTDTLYVLQGRDENDMRRLRASDESILLGESELVLFGDESCYQLLAEFIETKPSIQEAINQNFTADFDGYHSHKG